MSQIFKPLKRSIPTRERLPANGTVDANMHVCNEFLLPYIDQGNLFNQINFSVPNAFGTSTGGPINASSMSGGGGTYTNYTVSQNVNLFTSTVIPAFMCPSTPRSNTITIIQDQNFGSSTPWFQIGSGNDYTGLAGLGSTFKTITRTFEGNPNDLTNGIMSDGVQCGGTKIAQITDGLSNTILLGELAGLPNFYAGDGTSAIMTGNTGKVTLTAGGSTVTHDIYGGTWTDYNTAGENFLDGQSYPGPGVNMLGSKGGACVLNCSNLNGRGLWSFHKGGVQVLMGDGTVRFLSQNMNSATFGELVGMDDGSVVGDF